MSLSEKRGHEYGVLHLYSPKSGPLLPVLNSLNLQSDYSAHFLISFGSVYVSNQRITHESHHLNAGDYLRIHTKPRRFLKALPPLREALVSETNEFIVINKTSAIPCHPTVDNIKENLLTLYSQEIGQDLYLTHRLDTPTSGLLLLAKTKLFQSEFNQLLKERLVQKKYLAQVQGHWKHQGLLAHAMEPSPRAPKKVVPQSEAPSDWPHCELIIEKIHHKENHSELKIELLTGRTHQIRAQCAASGHPILGDVLYGANKIYEHDEIALKAQELSFTTYRNEKYLFGL